MSSFGYYSHAPGYAYPKYNDSESKATDSQKHNAPFQVNPKREPVPVYAIFDVPP
jgi:hypothetical protein